MYLRSLILGSLIALQIVALAPDSFGGSVITTNLPTNTVIANIDAREDGANRFNGDQSLWYQPFFAGGATQLVECTLPAGSYNFRLVSPSDAARFFPSLTSDQTNQMFSAWTYNSPWITDYLVFDGAAATASSIPQIFDGANNDVAFGNPTDAYNHAVATGEYQQIRTGTNGRDGTIYTNVYTFTNTATLIFVIPDSGLSDNSGGVSVLVSPAMPKLNISANGSTVNLQWQTNAAASFHLEQTANLVAPVWSPVSAAISVVNTNILSVIVPQTSGNQFFRLRSP